jgi:hypothetical protein
VLVYAYQRDGLSIVASPACTTNAVNVVFSNVRQVKVYDVRQLINVESSGSDIGCD